MLFSLGFLAQTQEISYKLDGLFTLILYLVILRGASGVLLFFMQDMARGFRQRKCGRGRQMTCLQLLSLSSKYNWHWSPCKAHHTRSLTPRVWEACGTTGNNSISKHLQVQNWSFCRNCSFSTSLRRRERPFPKRRSTTTVLESNSVFLSLTYGLI